MSAPRIVTLVTTDHGKITLPEPAWCTGHADHRPGFRCDILHCGPDVALAFRGVHISAACLVQAPFSNVVAPENSGRQPGVSVSAISKTLDPAGLYELAAAFDGYADRLRDLADELTAILPGSEGR